MSAIITTDEPVVRVSGALAWAGPDSASLTDGTVERVGPTGISAVEPLVSVARGDRTAFHFRCSPERVEDVISGVEEATDSTATDPDAVVDQPDATRSPIARLPEAGAGVRDVLGACGWLRPTEPADHEAAGGFGEWDPETVLDVGTELRGRGWGDLRHDERLAETWSGVRDADGEAAVVVNAHGNAADTLLLASAPFEVLEGAGAVARTVDADRIVVYASADEDGAVRTVREAIENYPDPPAEMEVATGPAEHRAAEPTMALEAIEGNHRLEARIRPPGPDEVGLHGRPTLVHTPRTLAQLAVALREGRAPETRILTVTGDVDADATIELPETATLETALDAVDVAGEFKAVSVGGRFGGLTADPDVRVAPDPLRDADLGTEGDVRVLAADRCVVEFVGRQAQFAAGENCGRCVPCREGSTQLVGLLRDVYGEGYDPGGIAELTDVMSTSSLCAFGVQAGRPARTAIAEFESEFEAHAAGRCPAGSCLETAEVSR